MGLFSGMLGSGESVFRTEEALDPEWVPKLLPFREQQQRRIAACIRPLLEDRNGRNAFVSGAPGIGKTAATKWVLRDLEDETDDVAPIYVNCWQKNTPHKIYIEIARQLGFHFVQNLNTEQIFDEVKQRVNKRSAVFVFDEVDKAEDVDFLYALLNEVYKKSIILITNDPDWLSDLEDRVKSRLLPELLDFKRYAPTEIKEIMRQRLEYAFQAEAMTPEAFELLAAKAGEHGDVRVGLHLLHEAGLAAEEESSKKVRSAHAEAAIGKMGGMTTKKDETLEDETKAMLDVVKAHSGQKIGDLFRIYREGGGAGLYKTFQRRIAKLEKAGFVSTKKVMGGAEGTTTIVSFASAAKTLSEF